MLKNKRKTVKNHLNITLRCIFTPLIRQKPLKVIKMKKIEALRKLISVLPPSPLAGSIGSNSTVKHFKSQYLIFAGGINPEFEGSYDECKKFIEQEIERHEICNNLQTLN